MNNLAPTIGILGGGQLARMTAYAAFRLGVRVHIMERYLGSPAGEIAHKEVIGDPSDHDLLLSFASECDVVTLESEFINEEHLAVLEKGGHRLFPRAHSVGQIQDKLVQKQTLLDAAVPVAPFAPADTDEDAIRFAEAHGYPFLLKARRGGYDGYGNATVTSPEGIAAAREQITRGDTSIDLYCEAFVNFTSELAVMIIRGIDGAEVTYPVVETVQQNHICHYVTAPAMIDTATADAALAYACRSVEAIDGVGTFGVELFLTASGGLLVNEMAPRPHNSGHYTIEGCVTSQFENHVRAVMGLPLGSSELRAPAVAMANILGRADESGTVKNYHEILAEPRVHLHIYGKQTSRTGRKMGHVTALAATAEEALRVARVTEERVKFGG
jgi:5-(carboxyamino)imidazole ribonucleotide synthase